MIFFQAPWLPEFMLAGGDYAFLEAAFRSGPIAPRSQGVVTDEDIERCGVGLPGVGLMCTIDKLSMHASRLRACRQPGFRSLMRARAHRCRVWIGLVLPCLG